MNTRFGVNFPLIAYLDLTGQNPEPQITFREGLPYLVVGKDFRACLDFRRQGALGLTAWIRGAASARVFPFLDKRDPLPFLVAVARALWRRLRNLRDTRGRGIPEAGVELASTLHERVVERMETMNGVAIPGVSAGSNPVGASEM